MKKMTTFIINVLMIQHKIHTIIRATFTGGTLVIYLLIGYLTSAPSINTIFKKGEKPMKEVTKLLINDFKIKELGYDFMGFSLCKNSLLSFHHLILSKEYCKKAHLGKGYWYWNGVILCQDTSHEYLHLIQRYEPIHSKVLFNVHASVWFYFPICCFS